VSTIADILAEHAGKAGALLPILHDVQKAVGYISEDAIRDIAQALNLTRAEVYGVVSFYHDFRKEAENRPVIKLCRAEACKARGVEALVPLAEGQSRIKVESSAPSAPQRWLGTTFMPGLMRSGSRRCWQVCDDKDFRRCCGLGLWRRCCCRGI
jgi:formate dehydrogenase subunit gamma